MKIAGTFEKCPPAPKLFQVETPDLNTLWSQWTSCTRCPLHKGKNKVVIGSGWPGARVLAIGMAPGKDEDITGRPFCGPAGDVVRKYTHEVAGLPVKDVFYSNILGCKPPSGNFGPVWSPHEEAVCLPRIENLCNALDVKLIIGMGSSVARFFGITKPMDKIRQTVYKNLGRYLVIVTFPAQILRNPQVEPNVRQDYEFLGTFYQEIMND